MFLKGLLHFDLFEILCGRENSFCGVILTIERDYFHSILAYLRRYMAERNSFCGMILTIERDYFHPILAYLVETLYGREE